MIVPIAKLLDYRRVYLSELPKDSKDRKSVFAGSCVLSHNFWVSNVSNYFRRALPRSLGFVYHRCILNTYERLLFKMCIWHDIIWFWLWYDMIQYDFLSIIWYRVNIHSYIHTSSHDLSSTCQLSVCKTGSEFVGPLW